MLRVAPWLILVACTALLACGHEPTDTGQRPTVDYQSPVDFDVVLAGNFGEPRPWHFHGGLDIKTNNEEGKVVRAIADGYVSRLTVGLYGFGNAIYVAHPDGRTSVYCHLKRFTDTYEQLIRRTGWGDTISVWLEPDKYRVAKGDQIAVSGNTGHSTGPHLHLELHDTKTWVMRDPMAVMAPFVSDTVAPLAHSFMAIPQAREGLFNGGSTKQTFGFNQPDVRRQHTTWALSRQFTAWGRVGFALWADDYAHTTYNHYGIRRTRLLVDGREVFRSEVDSIPVSCQPEVNVWGDFRHWCRTHVWYMKSYSEPGMRLPILHTGFDRGIVTFDEARPYHLRYELTDFHGNQSTYDFTVTGLPDSRIHPRRRLSLLNTYLLYGQCLWPRYTLRTPATDA